MDTQMAGARERWEQLPAAVANAGTTERIYNNPVDQGRADQTAIQTNLTSAPAEQAVVVKDKIDSAQVAVVSEEIADQGSWGLNNLSEAYYDPSQDPGAVGFDDLGLNLTFGGEAAPAADSGIMSTLSRAWDEITNDPLGTAANVAEAYWNASVGQLEFAAALPYNLATTFGGGLVTVGATVATGDLREGVAFSEYLVDEYYYSLRTEGAQAIAGGIAWAAEPIGEWWNRGREWSGDTAFELSGDNAVVGAGGYIGLDVASQAIGGIITKAVMRTVAAKGVPSNTVLEGPTELDPRLVRTTQTTKKQGETLRAITENMRQNGFVVEPDKLIDVVRMPDGGLTSLDNTRVVAADLAGVKIQARVHSFDDLMPDDKEFISRFIGRKGEVPVTWGDAVHKRIGKQSPSYRNTYPDGSPFISFGRNY